MLYAFDTTPLFIKSICCIAHLVTRFCALYIIHVIIIRVILSPKLGSLYSCSSCDASSRNMRKPFALFVSSCSNGWWKILILWKIKLNFSQKRKAISLEFNLNFWKFISKVASTTRERAAMKLARRFHWRLTVENSFGIDPLALMRESEVN